jgi:hypothetical protein
MIQILPQTSSDLSNEFSKCKRLIISETEMCDGFI